MAQASIVYRHNTRPTKWLAASGILFAKWMLAVPHFVIVGILGYLAMSAAYIGYFIVAFTGSLPGGIQDFVAWWLRWWVRAYGWVAGIDDVYPPFDTDPTGYGIDAELPRNQSPGRGLAVAGIFFVKLLAALPHLLVAGALAFVSMIAIWVGYVAAAFTGELPAGIQDLVAGTFQWFIRITSWVAGLTDEYPPFSLEITPGT